MCSNGLGHQADETEFDEALAHGTTPPAVEAAEPREMFGEEQQVLLGDDTGEQVGTADDVVKLPDEGATCITASMADQQELTVGPADHSQHETLITSDHERPTEVEEELEQEVEGKCSF